MKKLIKKNFIAYIIFIIIANSLIFILYSCSPEPEPIDYGNDTCSFCKMNITDNKFAAEIVKSTGLVLKFDSIECMFKYKNIGLNNKLSIASEWVNDFSEPGKLINLKKAFFLKTDLLRSPMGLNVLSFSSEKKLNNVKSKYGGMEMNYNQVKELAQIDK